MSDEEKTTSVKLSRMERFVRSHIQHYDAAKYWKYRDQVVNYKHRGVFGKLIASRKLLYIKKCDAYNNASLGTHLGFGARFKAIPKLPHGLYGIVVSHQAVIGSNVEIFHQVTIGEGKGGAPTIGDNVLIGTGAKIIGNIKIGNNVKIGAGCVVARDIPDNCTVVLQPPRVIVHSQESNT